MSASGPLHRFQLTRRLVQAASRRGAKREWRRWLILSRSLVRGMMPVLIVGALLCPQAGYSLMAAGIGSVGRLSWIIPGFYGFVAAAYTMDLVIRSATRFTAGWTTLYPVPPVWHVSAVWRHLAATGCRALAVFLLIGAIAGQIRNVPQALMFVISGLGAAACGVGVYRAALRFLLAAWGIFLIWIIAGAVWDFPLSVVALNPASWAWLGMRSLHVDGDVPTGLAFLVAAAAFSGLSLWMLHRYLCQLLGAHTPEPLGPKAQKGPVPNYPVRPVATPPGPAASVAEDSPESPSGEPLPVATLQEQEGASLIEPFSEVRMLNLTGTKAAAAAALRRELNGLQSREPAESAGTRIAQAWTGLESASAEHERKIVLLALFAFVPVLLLLGFTGSRIDPWKLIALNAALVAVSLLIARLRATTREMTIVSQSWLEVMPVALSDHASLCRRTWQRGDRAALWFSLIFAAACLSIQDFTLLHAAALAGLGGILPWLLFPAMHLFHLTVRERTTRGRLARWLEAAPHMLVFAAYLLLLAAPALSWRLLAPGWIHWNFLAWVGCLHVTAQAALFAWRRHWTQLL